MATSQNYNILPQEALTDEDKEFFSSLPREDRWGFSPIYQYQGFWYLQKQLLGMLSCQQHFQARDTDHLLATMPKSGATWLKALAFAIMNRSHYSYPQHPLLTNNPHTLVPGLEIDVCPNNRILEVDGLVSTHLPFVSLPESIKDSNCKVVYLCRNPRDVFISFWHFANKLTPKTRLPISLEEAFDLFCAGILWCGPIWDHVLGYWKASLESPQKVMFLKYEDLKREPMVQLKRLAEFLGYPFTPSEERAGVPEDILRLCSFDNLCNLEVNKTGKIENGPENKLFFRRGEVGDSLNYLTPQMIEQLDQVVEEKLQGSGLAF